MAAEHNISYEVIRSKRKTLALSVNTEAHVIVRAPLLLPDEKIRSFVQEKHPWIMRKQEEMREKTALHSPITLAENERLCYRGKPYTVLRRQARCITLEGDYIVVPQDMTLDTFTLWMKAQARATIAECVEFYALLMNVQYASIRISSARSRWGSCGAGNTLNFTWRLIMCPDWIIEYVVVHELAHITEKNHSTRFWSLVGQHFPNYGNAKQWLRTNNRLMDVL